MTRLWTRLSALSAVLAVGACGFVSERMAIDDPRLSPVFAAIKNVDRTAMGFTDISRDAELRMEWRPRARYDAVLHVYGNTSRTIAFARNSTGWEWIGEQEIVKGPRTYRSPDGVLNESITITYETRQISGVPSRTVYIAYAGEDAELTAAQHLTLARIRPTLDRWAGRG